jgi:hypothetical protein
MTTVHRYGAKIALADDPIRLVEVYFGVLCFRRGREWSNGFQT